LVFGDFTADILWYLLGRYGSRAAIFKFGKIIGLTPAVLEKMENKFLKYHQKILIISKLTMGMGFAAVILVVAGIFKVPFKNYFFLTLVGGFIWTAFLVAIGYFFGNVFALISGPAKIVFACFALLIVIFGLRSANNFLRTKEI
jgi:membrane protein DedA with SNARE-associated domain